MPQVAGVVAGVIIALSGLGSLPLHAIQNPPAQAAQNPTTTDTAVVLDPIARLQRALEKGAVQLPYDSALGYLPGLLEVLEIPVSSQTLVFSRTSLQTDRIAPWAPRALYFNDDVYVGYVQESGFLEIAAVHPTDGGAFYTLPQDPSFPPQFQYETTTCLMCHESRSMTGGVPGFVMRSVLTDRLGYPLTNVDRGSTADGTPMEARWGGWYVTGTHGDTPHAGNVAAPDLVHEVSDKRRYLEEFDLTGGANTLSLAGHFDPTPYPSAHSDIVALMVLAHQVQIHNLVAMAHAATADALTLQRAMRSSGRSQAPADSLSPAALTRMEGAADRLVRELFFSGSEPLHGPVHGTSGFADEWPGRGPQDSMGRSLRDLDLETRLFKHPLSFLVYSDAFQALPPVMLDLVYQRIDAVLSAEEPGEDFAHLSGDDRTAIREILEGTLPSFVTATSESRQ